MIRVDVDGRGWQELGADLERGIEPAGVAPAWDAWGPASLTFTLARDPSRPWADLTAATPIEYVPPGGGEAASWGGFIQDTPAAGESGITVNARGWQYAGDDDPYVDTYAIADLSKWQDLRGFPGSALTGVGGSVNGWNASGQVQTGTDGITFGWSQGSVIPVGSGVGVYLDLGPLSRGAKRIVITLNGINTASSGNLILYARANDNGPAILHSGPPGYDDAISGAVIPSGAGTFTGTFATAHRYVSVFLYCPTGSAATTIDYMVRVDKMLVVTDTAYEAGNVSILKAHQVALNALTKVPALSQDTSLIGTTAFSIPSYGGVNEPRTFRQDVEGPNSYHRWITRVNADRRFEFRPRFGNATLEANTRRPGVDWQDASPNSLEDVWNGVTVKGRSGNGAELAVTRTSADVGISNVLDRRGRKRTKVLEVAAPTDTAAMQQLADVWLVRYARTPLKGTLTITGPEALRELPSANPVPAGYVGARTGELVLLSNLVDPDTGAHGREAVTAGATYAEAGDVATLAIDNTRDDLEALLARMGVVAGA